MIVNQEQTERPNHVTTARVGILLGVLMAAGLGALVLFDRDGLRLERHLWVRLPVVAIVAMPAILAILGLRRPPALLAAGVLSVPTAFLSFAGVTLPLLIPGAFYLVAYGRAPSVRGRVPTTLLAVFAVAISVGAFATSISERMEICTKSITYSDGRTVERVTSRNGQTVEDGQSAMRIGDRGPDVVAEERGCSSQPTPRASGLALGLLAAGALAIGWMSAPQTRSEAFPGQESVK